MHKVVRFWYAKPDGSEYLVECRVECEPPVDSEIELTSAPCLYTVDVLRAETDEGVAVSADEFLSCWGDLEYFAVQATDYGGILMPRFFSDELEQAEMHYKTLARELTDAEECAAWAAARVSSLEHQLKDAKNQLQHVRKIQSVPVV